MTSHCHQITVTLGGTMLFVTTLSAVEAILNQRIRQDSQKAR
jgi:hypothetical protein